MLSGWKKLLLEILHINKFQKVTISSVLIVSFTCATATENIISFLSQSTPIKLSNFMDFMRLNKVNQDEFSYYYGNIIDTMCFLSLSKKKIELQRLQQNGINNLEIKHPEWADEISRLLKKNNSFYNNVRIFVIRYASLESYFEQKARGKNSIFAKVRSFLIKQKKQ